MTIKFEKGVNPGSVTVRVGSLEPTVSMLERMWRNPPRRPAAKPGAPAAPLQKAVRGSTEVLEGETRRWTAPIVRRYAKDQNGQELRLLEAQILAAHGYAATPIGDDAGKLKVKKLAKFARHRRRRRHGP